MSTVFEEKMAEKFPKFMMTINPHTKKTKLILNMKNTKNNPSRHIESK